MKKGAGPRIEYCNWVVPIAVSGQADAVSSYNHILVAAGALYEDEEVFADIKQSLDQQITAIKQAWESNLRLVNCAAELLQLGETAVRAVCSAQDCPLYPDGPQHVATIG